MDQVGSGRRPGGYSIPSHVQAAAATLAAYRAASIADRPRRRAAMNPATNASPAPLVSTTRPGGAVAGIGVLAPSGSATSAPRAPLVITRTRPARAASTRAG